MGRAQEVRESVLSTGQAARFLGVSRQAVIDLCNRGRLASFRVPSPTGSPAGPRRILRRVAEAFDRSRGGWFEDGAGI